MRAPATMTVIYFYRFTLALIIVIYSPVGCPIAKTDLLLPVLVFWLLLPHSPKCS